MKENMGFSRRSLQAKKPDGGVGGTPRRVESKWKGYKPEDQQNPDIPLFLECPLILPSPQQRLHPSRELPDLRTERFQLLVNPVTPFCRTPRAAPRFSYDEPRSDCKQESFRERVCAILYSPARKGELAQCHKRQVD